MRCLTTYVFVLLPALSLLVNTDALAPLAPVTQRSNRIPSEKGEGKGPLLLEDGEVSLLLLESDENDSSRRIFVTGVIGLGLMAGMEGANAAELEPGSSTEDSLSSSSTMISDAAAVAAAPVDFNAIIQKASKRALGGGKAGASAAVVQVCSLMWLRTSMNYQVSSNIFTFILVLNKKRTI